MVRFSELFWFGAENFMDSMSKFRTLWLLWIPVVLELVVLQSSLSSAAPSKDSVVGTDRNVWLADEEFYDDLNIYDRPQGDQAMQQDKELCPPVPAILPDGSCHAQKCNSDRECAARGNAHWKCCYNGCIYTCLPELLPPAFLDWIREPRRRLSSGLSWLITGPDLANEEEPCSTTPVDDDSDPLLCPQGYFCDIYDAGDSKKGIPNQGVCIKLAGKETDDGADLDSTSKEDAKSPDTPEVFHAHACDMDGKMLLEGHAVKVNEKLCVCKSRKLDCDGEAKDTDDKF